ncbi:hypothetical protein [Alcanivorax sp.]|nr:hypothetical protein [Alcanivorax sp.]
MTVIRWPGRQSDANPLGAGDHHHRTDRHRRPAIREFDSAKTLAALPWA